MNQKENQNQILPQQETKVKIETELQPDDWLCLSCSKKITTDKERLFYEEKSEFQFRNPEGDLFDIITFSSADGCRDLGKPIMEFTWFPGHPWSFGVCNRCGLHLGWKYTGKHSFYGLIKARLVKGQALFN